MILLPIGPIKQFKRENTYCCVYSAERNTFFLISHGFFGYSFPIEQTLLLGIILKKSHSQSIDMFLDFFDK